MSLRLETLALTCALALTGACASTANTAADDLGEAAYMVTEENARIFPADSINGYEVVDEDTVLLRAGVNRLYLGDVWSTCGRDLRFVQTIGIDNGPSSTVDSFATAIIDGRRCPLQNLRRVERIEAASDAPAPAQ